MIQTHTARPWWKNWKLLASAAIGVAIVGGAIVLVSINNSDIKTMAMARVAASPLVTQRLGEPITSSWFVRGNLMKSPDSGKADLTIPISGPRGAGTVYVHGSQTAEGWQMTSLKFAQDGSSDRLDLLSH